MRKPLRPRRFLALLATYVVVLQALLLPLSVAAGAFIGGEICSAARAERGHAPANQPAGSDAGCACAAGCGMQGCAQLLAPPPAAQPLLDARETGVLAPLAALSLPRPLDDRGGYAARAPPQA